MTWLQTDVESRGLFEHNDMHNLFHINEVGKIVQFIRRAQEDRATMEHVCVNYNQYRLNLTQNRLSSFIAKF